ncbi:GtrA family protein [Tenggerimyces flavus]|uniref:GtrA family protein n=1 Tax=Tenggerimyces flavus TaxID=1708749 RepID=A0ABV7Y2J1_9ACTN|nr:GtrA family protein [Tenggerimyces flavus]MBM7790749.1 putative flippase GtrA [Tenggerimyces flavus]
MKLLKSLYGKVDKLAHEVAKFGIIGAVAFVVDMGAFNLLRYDFDGSGILQHKPLTARVISVCLATIVAYFGNRHWTWKNRERRALHFEYSLFFVLNGVGLVLNLAVLGFVIYVLNLHDPLSNNLANLFGIGCGTIFRFWSYRRFLFREVSAPSKGPEEETEVKLSSAA